MIQLLLDNPLLLLQENASQASLDLLLAEPVVGYSIAYPMGVLGMMLAIALATLWLGHKLLKIPMSLLIGMLAGLQTQPAVLGFALEQTGNELPNCQTWVMRRFTLSPPLPRLSWRSCYWCS